MSVSLLLAQAQPGPWGTLGLITGMVLVFLFFLVLLNTQYKRCPPNRILVKYGKVRGAQAAQCIHGGGAFIIPIFQY